MQNKQAKIVDNYLVAFNGQQKIPLKELLDRVHHTDSDGILIGGTIVEGIGNHLSDFDIYVICGTKPNIEDVDPTRHHWLYHGDDNNSVTITSSGQLFQIFDYVGEKGQAIDVEYWSYDDLSHVENEVETAYQDLMRHCFRATRFSYKKAGFLHKALGAITIAPSEQYTRFQRLLSSSKLCYILFRQHAGGYPTLRDISGAWYADNLDAAVHLTREHVFDQMMALTFLEHLTNPGMKWIFKKVEALSLESKNVADAFLEFAGMPSRATSEKREFVLAGLALIDKIFERFWVLLDSDPEFMSTQNAIQLTHNDRAARDFGSDEFERQLIYRLKMYQGGHPSCGDLLRMHRPIN